MRRGPTQKGVVMGDGGTIALVIIVAAVIAIGLWYFLTRRDKAGSATATPSRAAAPPAAKPVADPAPLAAAAATMDESTATTMDDATAASDAALDSAAATLDDAAAAPAPLVDTAAAASEVEVAATGTLEIVEIHHGSVAEAVGEWVQITNAGYAPVQLAGWRLTDEGTRHAYTFPSRVLAPGASLRLHMWQGEDDDNDIYVGAQQRWWNDAGDTAYLYDPEGTLVHAHSYGAAASG
jgi:hypothetical protein